MGKIALVHDFFFTYGGAERVVSTFHELFPDAPIYTLFHDENITKKHFPHATIIPSYLQKSPLRSFPPFLLASFPRAIESFDFTEFDTVLSSSGAFSHGIITGPETHHVSYCHTPMRYSWDWHHEYIAERGFKNPVSLFLIRNLLSKLRLWDTISAKRVDHFLSNSGVVASRIEKFYRQSAQVVYPPIDTEYYHPKNVTPQKGEPYLISASRLSPNKRIDLMIKASAQTSIPLKIVGGGSALGELQKLSKSLKAPVTFLGKISEDEKREQIGNARAFLFTAEDDFGIGPAEALSLGVPVISIARGGIQEVIKTGKNGILFLEPTHQSLSDAIDLFMKEGVEFSSSQIHASVQNLSIERFKKEITESLFHAHTL